MKQLIIDALKTKFNGVEEQMLSRIANKLVKTITTSEQVEPIVEGITLQILLENYGDSRATQAAQTTVNNYKKWHAKNNSKKLTSDTCNSTAKSAKKCNAPAWAKTLLEASEALNKKVAAMESEKTTARRRQQISRLVEKLPESLRSPYYRINVETISDEDFAAMFFELTTEVAIIYADLFAQTVVFQDAVKLDQAN